MNDHAPDDSAPMEVPMNPDRESAPDGAGPETSPGDEPVTTGTLFVMILFLMALAGMWGLMYLILLER